MDRAVADRTETVVARSGQEAVVVVGKAEWDAIQETLHLLPSPANAARLRTAVAQLGAGGGTARDLIDDEAALR
jgi:antitoxin YefM